MKLTTALSAAAFILAPGAGFAMQPEAAAGQYPYPDWPAIAKTGPVPQQGAEEQKAGQSTEGMKSEPGILEKAKEAIESVTGGSAGIKEKAGQAIESIKGGTEGIKEKAGQAVESITGRSAGQQEEGASQMKAAGTAPRQEAQSAKGGAQYPYPDWPSIAKTGSSGTSKP